MTVVFIACLPKSGSTVLDLLLSSHPRCWGLGEVYQLVRDDSFLWQHLTDPLCGCSCGKLAVDCEFWSEVTSRFSGEDAEASELKKYEFVLNQASRAFGTDCTVIDSSKDIAALALLRRIPGINLKIIYLIKDVRAWTTSQCADEERERRRALHNRGINLLAKSRIRRHLEGNAFWIFHSWYRRNRELRDYITTSGLEHRQISYEALCFSSEPILRNLSEFLGFASDAVSLNIAAARSHNILGNRMRFQREKRNLLIYDNRWFGDRKWLLPALIFPQIMGYNQAEVYGSDAIPEFWSR